jgi:hypothetical protein
MRRREGWKANKSLGLIAFWLIRIFDRGEFAFNDMFNGPVTSYESNIAYTLRFMIDNKVSFNSFPSFLCTGPVELNASLILACFRRACRSLE